MGDDEAQLVSRIVEHISVPFTSPRFPAGDDAWQDSPAQPLQLCALPGAPTNHGWVRDVECFTENSAGELLQLPVAECVRMSMDQKAAFPAFSAESGMPLRYAGEAEVQAHTQSHAEPRDAYSYSVKDACGVAWIATPWGGFLNVTP